jgi:hypothetical protein
VGRPAVAAGWNKYLPLPAGPQPAVRFPPSRSKRLPPPAHGHIVVIGGLPGWHTTLIVVTAAVLAAAVVVILPRPGSHASRRRRPRLNHRRPTSPRAQPRLRPGRAPKATRATGPRTPAAAASPAKSPLAMPRLTHPKGSGPDA